MDIYGEISDFFSSVNAEKRVIGKSVFGRKIYAVKLGYGSPVGISQYAIHGREFITAKLAVSHFLRGIGKGSVWILPLVNPDGALLAQTGLSTVPFHAKKRIAFLKGDGFPLWKANGRGVDLNVNFDAEWGKGKRNVFSPSAENFVGKRPVSEPETKALTSFTARINPDYTVSWHTKGEEIYWYFSQPLNVCARDKALAEVLSRSTGYPLEYAQGSVGGYKDWCIQNGIPSFTVECGADSEKHPLGLCAFEKIERDCKNALYDLSEAVFAQKEKGLL